VTELSALAIQLQESRQDAALQLKKSNQLKRNIKHVIRTLKVQNQQLVKYEEQHLENQGEIAKLREDRDKFREIILNGAQAPEATDEELVREFASIRQKIQSLAFSKVLQVQNSPYPVGTLALDELRELKTVWERYDGNFRVQVLRASLFRILCRCFLFKNFFGLPAPNKTPTSGKTGVSCSDAELGLFEVDMRKRNG
jgi:hypothetical protein